MHALPTSLSSGAGRRALRSSVHGNLVGPFARSATVHRLLTRSFLWLVQQP